jgi:enamine deaminase RidA (YjgF/YER057c/UK114 family)
MREIDDTRQKIATGAPWEDFVGYSRAVRIGPFIYITGTIAVDAVGNIIGPGDAYLQTRAILEGIRLVLAEADALLEDVVRTRLFVTDIANWEAIGRAHREFFGEIRPCTTMVEVSRLIAPEALVEIEADAVVSAGAE